MRNTYWDIRNAACGVFIKMGNEAVEPLIEVLADQNWVVREGAVLALGKIADPRAIQPLIEAFKDTNAKRITDALKSIGPIALNPLIKALTSGDSRIRIGAATALGEMKNPTVLDEIDKLAKDKDPMVRQVAKCAKHRIKWETSPKKKAHFS